MCSTLSNRQRILNMKLLTCFHKAFWVTFICSAQSSLDNTDMNLPLCPRFLGLYNTLSLFISYEVYQEGGHKRPSFYEMKFLEVVWERIYKTHFLKGIFFCNSNYSRNQHALSGMKTRTFLSSTSSHEVSMYSDTPDNLK